MPLRVQLRNLIGCGAAEEPLKFLESCGRGGVITRAFGQHPFARYAKYVVGWHLRVSRSGFCIIAEEEHGVAECAERWHRSRGKRQDLVPQRKRLPESPGVEKRDSLH